MPGRAGEIGAKPLDVALDAAEEVSDWLQARVVAPLREGVSERLKVLPLVVSPRKRLRDWGDPEVAATTLLVLGSDPDGVEGQVAFVFEQDPEVLHRADMRRARKQGQVARYGVYVMDWVGRLRSDRDGSWIDYSITQVHYQGFPAGWDSRSEALDAARAAIARPTALTFFEARYAARLWYRDEIKRGPRLADDWSERVDQYW